MLLSNAKRNKIMNARFKKMLNVSKSDKKFILQNFYNSKKITFIAKKDNKYQAYYRDINDYNPNENDLTNSVYVIVPDEEKIIKGNSFNSYNYLEQIILPNTIEVIGSNSFAACRNLRYFYCPQNLVTIEKNAFSDCDDLKNVYFNSGIKEIQTKAFNNCYSITSLIIPNSVEKIGREAFMYCSGLTNIFLPDKLIEIAPSMLRYCCSLKNISIPTSVTTIRSRAFEHCRKLKTVEIPENVQLIETLAFGSCSDLTSVVFKNKMDILNSYMFESCFSLKNVTLPDNLVEMKEKCFSICSSLQHIKLPESLTKIGSNCFYQTDLKEITFPRNLTYVGERAFTLCDSLDKVVINSKCEFDFDCFDNQNLNYIIYDKGNITICKDLPENVNSNYIELPQTKHKLKLLNTLINFDYKTSLYLLNFYNKTKIPLTYKFVNDLMANNTFYQFINSANTTFYTKILNDLFDNVSSKEQYALEKFCLILGAFEKPNTYTSSKDNEYYYDFATTAFNFLRKNRDKIIMDKVLEKLNGLNYREFNPQLAKFLMQKMQRNRNELYMLNNFNKILLSLKSNSEFLTKICNDFELLQQLNQRKKGAHQTLSPNFEFYAKIIKDVKYSGVTEENKHIAKALNEISADQSVFEECVKIYANLDKNNIPHHILNKPLSKTMYFADADKVFTYEFLDKYDAQNFTLGYKTSSCASINNFFGNGIAKANFYCPTVQNLVIRDENGNIFAKAILYVNKEQNYGIFNIKRKFFSFINKFNKNFMGCISCCINFSGNKKFFF